MNEHDKFNEEEYHFVDDPEFFSTGEEVAPESELRAEVASEKSASPPNRFQALWAQADPLIELVKNNFAVRVGIIGVAIFILILMIYRCTSHSNIPAHKMTASEQAHQQAARNTVVQNPATIHPAMAVMENPGATTHRYADEKLALLQTEERNLENQVSVLNQQVTTMGERVNIMADNLKQLSDQMAQLAVAVGEQTKITTDLAAQLKPHLEKNKAVQRERRSFSMPPVRYFLQAVIPGRAWVLNSNGDTLTVREGTRIADYGVVRYIDAKRGRVLTSSGKMIKFSQDDS